MFTIALNGYAELFTSCIKTHKSYCNQFGLKHQKIDHTPKLFSADDSAWLKIILLREALKCDYEWIAFIDADCQIRKHMPDFRSSMNKLDPDASIYMAHGFSGRINSGVIFIKNTAESKDYLDKVIINRNNPVPEEDKAPFENGHMITYGKNNPSVKIIDNYVWNNNVTFDPESYIQHYSGGILRPLYLKEQPIANMIYQIRKKWKMKIRKYKNDSVNHNLEHSIPWFKKEYPEFNEVTFPKKSI